MTPPYLEKLSEVFENVSLDDPKGLEDGNISHFEAIRKLITRGLWNKKFMNRKSMMFIRESIRDEHFPGKDLHDIESIDYITELRIDAMQLLWPDYAMVEFRRTMIRSVEECLDLDTKEVLHHGSSGCTKTSTFGMLGVYMWLESPKYASIYIVSPTKDATEDGIWANVKEFYDEAKERFKNLPGELKDSGDIIQIDPKKYPRGFIKVVTAQKVGRMVGKKARKVKEGEEDKNLMMFIADELPEFPNKSIVRVLANLTSVPRFVLLGAGNFADVNDPLGILSFPAREGGYYALDVDTDHKWLTKRGGICYRYDGHRSPNYLAGKDLPEYDFVTTLKYINRQANTAGGRSGIDYMRYVRSFPVMGMDSQYMLSMNRLQFGGAYAEEGKDFVWTSDKIQYAGFCDPGFGGDPAVIWHLKFGKIIDSRSGEKRDHVHFVGPPTNIPIDTTLYMGQNLERDDVRTPEWQIVNFCVSYCLEKGIPKSNFGYDPSLRGGITRTFSVASRDFHPIDTFKPATSRPSGTYTQTYDKSKGSGVKELLAKDIYSNLNSEGHLSLACGVDNRQVSGWQFCKEAVSQATSRRWENKGGKKAIQSKKEWKADNEGRSPNELDCMVGCFEMARKRGFKLYSPKANDIHKKGSFKFANKNFTYGSGFNIKRRGMNKTKSLNRMEK